MNTGNEQINDNLSFYFVVILPYKTMYEPSLLLHHLTLSAGKVLSTGLFLSIKLYFDKMNI